MSLLKTFKLVDTRYENTMILVTGGTGYIGSHTCIALIEAGHEVIVVDNLTNSSIDSIARMERITGNTISFVEGDIRDEAFLRDIFTRFKITEVIHFAGVKAVGESIIDPLKYYDNNVTGTLSLLKVMDSSGCKNLIFSSSATVYGWPSNVPVKEDSPLSAANPYGQSKLFIEKILNNLYESDRHWNIVVLRYFNPAGAHESGLIGEAPNNIPNNLFPLVSQVAAGQRDSIKVFGGDYLTQDGTGVRDYIHVTDLANGHVNALSVLSDSVRILTINLGTGVGYSVLEIIKAFEKVSCHQILYSIVDRRPGDAAVCYADATYAKEMMGWSAKLTLAKMCEDQWRWQKNMHINL